MRLSALLCSAILFLTGCAGSQSSLSQSEANDFQIKKTICSMRQEVVDMLKSTPVKQPVCEGSIVKGCQPVLYFRSGKDELSEETIKNLDWAVRKMLHYERYHITITGYADQVGTQEDNLFLSEKRAKAVRAYLLDQGIEAERIQTEFKGEESPVCEEDFCNELNRRTELNIYPINNMFHNQKNEE